MTQDTTTQHTMILDVEASQLQRSIDAVEKELGQAVKQFDSLARSQDKFRKEAANTNAALSGMNRTLKRHEFAIKNSAFQLGDFFTQVAGGTSPMRAFAQQFGQFAQFLGPVGLGLSVAVPLIVAIAPAMRDASRETAAFQAALDAARKETAELVDENERLARGFDTLTELRLTRALEKQVEARVKLEQELSKTLEERRSGFNRDARNLRQRIAAAQALVQEAQAEVDAFTKAREENERLTREQRLNAELSRDVAAALGQTADNTARAANEAERFVSTLAGLGSEFQSAAVRAGVASGDIPPDALNDLPQSDADRIMERILENRRRLARQSSTSGGGGGASGRATATDEMERMNQEFQKAIKLANDFGATMETAFVDVGTSALDQFIDGLAQGEFAFRDFARGVLADLAKIMARSLVVSALFKGFGIGPGVNVADLTGIQRIVAQIGGLSVTPFAKGGVVNSPTVFPMSTGGVGLMGEAGAEAIVPLQRDSNGRMGVGAAPVVIHNYTGAHTTVEDRNGARHVIIGEAVQAARDDFTRSMVSGQGSWSRALEGGYTSRRKLV
ncbi:phage tail tape measure protein [Falsiruegeria mediterranea]